MTRFCCCTWAEANSTRQGVTIPAGFMPSVEAADMNDDVLGMTARVAMQDLKPHPVPVR